MHDPIAALLFCAAARRAHTVVVNGEPVVENGKLKGTDEDELINIANRIASDMVQGAKVHTGRDFLKARSAART